MWECSDEERLDVRQGCKGVGLMSSEKMMVQIFKLNILCYKYAIMWLLCLRGYNNSSMARGVEVLGEVRMDVRQRSRGVGGV